MKDLLTYKMQIITVISWVLLLWLGGVFPCSRGTSLLLDQKVRDKLSSRFWLRLIEHCKTSLQSELLIYYKKSKYSKAFQMKNAYLYKPMLIKW